MNNGRVEPRIMGMGPVPAVRKVLDRGSASGVPAHRGRPLTRSA
jgi:acetyl-CoA acetyltransferase